MYSRWKSGEAFIAEAFHGTIAVIFKKLSTETGMEFGYMNRLPPLIVTTVVKIVQLN